MHSLKRRDFCRVLAGLPFVAATKETQPSEQPHFFLQIVFSGGMDASYLFDARPLSFTDNGFLQNYLYRNGDSSKSLHADPRPIVWQDEYGGKTLVSPLIHSLTPYRSLFSVVNGVLMLSNGLVSHGQNMYFLFGGQSGNGDSFVPLLGQNSHCPLHSVHIGDFGGDQNEGPLNFASSVALDVGTGLALAADLRAGSRLDVGSPGATFLSGRFKERARGSGELSRGAAKLLDGWLRTPALGAALEAVKDAPGSSDLATSLAVAHQYFTAGVSSSLTIMVDHDPEIDVHGVPAAQDQLRYYSQIAAELETIFLWLTTTPYAQKQSMLDVTTVMIGTEFSRTMRQLGSPIDATGTDHNPLTNTVLLAGKKIQGGRIIGSSDLQSLGTNNNLSDLSGAHRQLDPTTTSIMGRPFDFKQQKSIENLRETFVLEEYLVFPSIVNTLMTLAGVNSDKFYRFGPGSSHQAPILSSLLKG